VTPLREGGSLPAIIEADDDGLYVLKFRGAGQGPRSLIAELISGEIARAINLPVPEIVFVELDVELARTEPDPEIQDLIRASSGLNLALDYLPGAVMFNPVADNIDKKLTSLIVWLDAFTANVDRTIRNTNMLMWHRNLYLIDHGASLYFHHNWENFIERSNDSFPLIKNHVLLQSADFLKEVDNEISEKITTDLIKSIVNNIPDIWIDWDSSVQKKAEIKNTYVDFLITRIKQPHQFLEEAIRAKSFYI
ncbi:MAG TPA: HipA family kinase, partial [Ignavibacteriaceae bacterium]|nr:HipA family kinase [Ignavibacteriaceae bacterium]